MVIEEHARLEILLPNETEWRYISENDIIQNSLSITSKCMDDGSFALGGVFSAQLSVKLRLQGTVLPRPFCCFSVTSHDKS
ncbi:MAG: hypothetical protein K2O29_11840 [Ruminococcus sp.]|nr:hypothetical protein [Ruminococcus sp.]